MVDKAYIEKGRHRNAISAIAIENGWVITGEFKPLSAGNEHGNFLPVFRIVVYFADLEIRLIVHDFRTLDQLHLERIDIIHVGDGWIEKRMIVKYGPGIIRSTLEALDGAADRVNDLIDCVAIFVIGDGDVVDIVEVNANELVAYNGCLLQDLLMFRYERFQLIRRVGGDQG